MAAINFNAAQYQPKYGGGGSLPPGKYKGVITDSAVEPTKKGNSGMLVLEIQVIEGPLSGGKMVDRLNLFHPDAQTVEIANRQLSAYCHVLNVQVVSDTAQLHNIPFCFEVGWQKGNEPTAEKPEGGYVEIKALADINGNEPGKARGPAAAPAAAPPPPPAAAPPAQVQPAGNGWGAAAPDPAPAPVAPAPGNSWGAQPPAAAPPAAPAASAGWGAAPPAGGGWGAK
jgi:hypothetical protein